jgi:nicotinate-nucleotide adenylyltransferase
MRLGVFGGTFDPVHYGHLMLAECCREQARLDRVWFLPAATPPHKTAGDLAPASARIDMLRLAVGGHEAFEVCTAEIDRGGVSFTVDTLAELRAADPARELFFLLGADMFADLPHWRDPQRVCELATPVVVRRPQAPGLDFDGIGRQLDLSAQQIDAIRRHQVSMPQMDISSSEIRRRTAAGRSIRYWTPRGVEGYIRAQGLYAAGSSS